MATDTSSDPRRVKDTNVLNRLGLNPMRDASIDVVGLCVQTSGCQTHE